MKTPLVCKLIPAGHLGRKLVSYISKKAVGMTADLGFGTMKLKRRQANWATAALTSHHGTSRASEVRHVVLSLPKGTPRKQAKDLLRNVWTDWIKAYAPDRAWVFALQFHNGVFHGHGAVANVGANGKPLNFQPHKVLAMAAMKFTEWTLPAAGLGKSKGLPIYTKTRKKLAVQDLAAALLDASGNIQPKVWDDLESQGLITGCRTRKDESLISFVYHDKRIRLSTLQRFIAHNQSMKTPTHNPNPPSVAIKKTMQPADPLPSKLVHTGLSPTKVASINAALLSANLVSKPAKPKKSRKPKHPTPPTQ